MPNFNPGLEGVVIGTTEISFIDGKEGRLLYRGYDIHNLVQATFEEVAHLLLKGTLPSRAELHAFRQAMVAERGLPGDVVDFIRKIPATARPMEVLRTVVSALSFYDAEAHDMSETANQRKAIRLTSKMATAIAYFGRLREGKSILEPDPTLSHAANFLHIFFGGVPDEVVARAFDVSLILHADHEMNASTFAARVTAATLSDPYSAITSAIGTLKGPLHGGANEAVMKMLLEIGDEDKAEAWVLDALSKKKRIMGFGHRVYKTEDPRATHLRQIADQLSRRTGILKWFRMSRVIEEIMNKEKGLYPNVDFYSASTYYLMGFPVDMFTPIFACSRITGWAAHLMEQYANNRLIRPEGEYVGPMRREYKPLDQRG